MRLIRIVCALTLLIELMLVPVQGRTFAANEDFEAGEWSLPYIDVDEHDYYAKALMFFTLTNLLIPSGDKFEPGQAISRGEFFQWLHASLQLAEGDEPADVNEVAQRLVQLGIIIGDANGALKLDSMITRAEAAVIFQRIRKLEPSAAALAQFTDVLHDSWYSEAVSAMTNYQLIRGKPEGRFAPHEGMTRAEAVTLLYRVFFAINQIEEILDNHLVISGRSFPYHSDLQGLFAEHNREALRLAAMNYVVKDGVIVEVTRLHIASNDKNHLVLDGGGTVIKGNLYVTRPSVELANLTVMGDLYVTNQVTGFSSDHLIVQGFTIFTPANDVDMALPIWTNDSDLGALIISRSVDFAPETDKLQSLSSLSPSRKKHGEVRIASNEQSILNKLQELGIINGSLGYPSNYDPWSGEDVVRIIEQLLSGAKAEIHDIETDYNSKYISAPYYDDYNNWASDNRYNLGMPDNGNSGYIPKQEVIDIIKRMNEQIQNEGSKGPISREVPIIIGIPEREAERRNEQRRSLLDVRMKDTERSVIVVSDTNISSPPDTTLPSVGLVDVDHFTVDSHIEHLVIVNEETTETSLTGSGRIDQVNIRSGGQITVAVHGEIGQLIITNPEVGIHVGKETIIHNIQLPDGIKLNDIISNIDHIASNIRQVNGEPYTPPAATPPSTDSGVIQPEEPVGPPTPRITGHELGAVVNNTVTVSVYTQHADAIYWVIPQFMVVDPTIRPQPDRIFGGLDYNPTTGEWIPAAYSGNVAVRDDVASITLDAMMPIDQIWLVAVTNVSSTTPMLSGAYTYDVELDYPGPGEYVKFTATIDSAGNAVMEGSVDGIPLKLEIGAGIDDEPGTEITLHMQKLFRSSTVHALNITGFDSSRTARVTLALPSAVSSNGAALFEKVAPTLEGDEPIWKYRGGYADGRWIRGTPTQPTSTLAIAVTAAVPTPQHVQAVANDSNSVTLSWSASAEATTYRIYRYSELEGMVFVAETTDTTYTDRGLSAGTSYEYEVTALNDRFESAHPSVRTRVVTP